MLEARPRNESAEANIIISEEKGFTFLETESISSIVFVKDDEIYKLNARDSVERQLSDFNELRDNLPDFSDRIINSKIISVKHEGKPYTCVIQSLIKGRELKKLKEEELVDALRRNKDFLLALLNYFFTAINDKEKYPDPIGYPSNPEYKNAINLLLEEDTGKILLCDVGLSPHEDTLEKYGARFYESDNVKTYLARMHEFQSFLLSL